MASSMQSATKDGIYALVAALIFGAIIPVLNLTGAAAVVAGLFSLFCVIGGGLKLLGVF